MTWIGNEFGSISFGVLLALAAASVGSFFGARAARWSAEVEGSPQAPSVRSACQTCGKTIRAWRLIPILSWLGQRGRCACPRRAPLRRVYVLCEAGAFIGAVAALIGWGASHQAIWLAAAAAFAAWAASTDLEIGLIPDTAAVGLLAVGMGSAIFAPVSPYRGPAEAYWGALLTGGLLYGAGLLTSALTKRQALGLGDVKLGAGLGALLGPYLIGPFFGISALSGLTQAFFGVLRGEKASKPRPFAPAMALGAAAALAAERIGLLAG